jgi:succinate dehydrogenase / fumarate reductase cytochrome b subunit
VLIAVTGLCLVLYLVLHLVGNLLFFFGPATFNEYSHMLISNPLVIPAEIGLAIILLIHVYKTGLMWLENRKARPEGYTMKQWAGYTSRKSVGSSTMIYTGLVTLAFIIVHLKQFKYGAEYQTAGVDAIRDLYRLEVEVFKNPVWVVLYVVSVVLVGFHLRHGISSTLQSLGMGELSKKMLAVGLTLAIIIGGGFALIPIVVYLFK